MQDVWQRIEAALERMQPGLARELNAPANEAALSQAEAVLRVALPQDYRSSALIHDGMALYLIDSYRLLSIADSVMNMRSAAFSVDTVGTPSSEMSRCAMLCAKCGEIPHSAQRVPSSRSA